MMEILGDEDRDEEDGCDGNGRGLVGFLLSGLDEARGFWGEV